MVPHTLPYEYLLAHWIHKAEPQSIPVPTGSPIAMLEKPRVGTVMSRNAKFRTSRDPTVTIAVSTDL
jgi:hypothetical protein